MVGLTIFIFLIAVAASWKQVFRVRLYYALLLMLNTSLLGCFLAMDLLLFFLFFEFMLLPMFFLIGIWGGKRRAYASVKFFLYTLFGSVFMLLVMVGLAFSYQETGAETSALTTYTFSLKTMTSGAPIKGAIFSSPQARMLGFWGLFIAFAIKLPVVPLHTWLPDAHVQASTPISVLLAGLLLKVGGYGLFRVAAGVFPDEFAASAYWLGLIAFISIIYGGLNALAQKNLKAMIAYSSVAHMGYVLLGAAALTPAGWNGANLQMFNHGVISAMLFLVAGVLYDRTGDMEISRYRGLWKKTPVFVGFAFVAFMAGLGLPGFSAFISEMLVFAGAFEAAKSPGAQLPVWLIVGSVFGIFLSAAYFLRAARDMFFGKFETSGGDDWAARLTDLSLREKILFAALTLFVLAPGVYPGPLLALMDETLAQLLEAL